MSTSPVPNNSPLLIIRSRAHTAQHTARSHPSHVKQARHNRIHRVSPRDTVTSIACQAKITQITSIASPLKKQSHPFRLSSRHSHVRRISSTHDTITSIASPHKTQSYPSHASTDNAIEAITSIAPLLTVAPDACQLQTTQSNPSRSRTQHTEPIIAHSPSTASASWPAAAPPP